MIDIHSHILPGIDDGSKDFHTTIEMLKNAVKCGTKEIVATPHYCIGYGETPYNKVKEMVQELNVKVKTAGIDIDIFHGQEVYYSNNMIKDYEEGIIGTINDSKYMLYELPMREFPEDALDTLYEMQLKGLTLIMAHPERYKIIIEKPERINDFIEEGILLQMNAGSIEGKFGKEVKKTAEILLKNNVYNFIGSDAHGIGSRCTGINYALDECSKIDINIKDHFYESSNNMLNNKNVSFEGQKIKPKKSIFSFFRK